MLGESTLVVLKGMNADLRPLRLRWELLFLPGLLTLLKVVPGWKVREVV